MQVARSSVRREIVWGRELGARVAADRRLKSFGSPSPVIGAGVRVVCCSLPEQSPVTLREVVCSSVLNVVVICCNSSGIIVLQW